MPELTAALLADGERYKRIRAGRVGAAHRVLGRREPHHRDPRHRRAAPSATRIEYRQTAADINPYIAMAACLAAGLCGHRARARAAARRSSGERATATRRAAPLPRTLEGGDGAACARSAAAREILGEAFVDHYVRTREWEVRQYERAVTEWELERYFEVIQGPPMIREFSFPTRIVFGKGALTRGPEPSGAPGA